MSQCVLHVVTPRSGDSDSDFAALHAFAERGGVLLAPPERLKGVEVNAAAGVAFDMPLSTGAMLVLMTRIHGRAAKSATLFALFDRSQTLPPEQRALERYGFIPLSDEADGSGASSGPPPW